MKIIKGLEHLTLGGRLRQLFSLEKRRLRGNLTDVCKCLRGESKEDGARLFFMVPSGRTRGNGHKPQ